MTKTIAIVTPYAFPETGAASIRVHSFATALSQKGFRAVIFAPTKKDFPQVEGNMVAGNTVIRFKRRKNLLNLFRIHDVSCVIASSPPADLGLIALGAAKLLRVPVIADIRDPWVFDKEAVGLIRSKTVKFAIQKKMEEAFYRLSDKRIVVTDATRKLFAEKLNISAESFDLIPNGVPVKFFDTKKKSRARIRKELGIPRERPLFIFLGSIWRDLPELMEHLTPLLEKKDAYLLIVGNRDSVSSERFVEKINETRSRISSERVKTLYNISPEEIPSYLAASDIGLNTLADSLYYSVPIKTYEYAFAGLPVLSKGPSHGALADLHRQLRAGAYASTWDAFEKGAELLLRTLLSRKTKARADAVFVEENFSRERLAEKLVEMVQRLI